MTGWLAKAEDDLAAAKIILGGALSSWGNSSFHSQQAAEKALKALLVRYQINFPKSHDIAALLLLAEPRAPGIAAALDAARVLTMYAVETRYPDSDPVSKADASRHVELADGVVTYVRRQLNAYLAAGRPRG